jgi:TolB-like protein
MSSLIPPHPTPTCGTPGPSLLEGSSRSRFQPLEPSLITARFIPGWWAPLSLSKREDERVVRFESYELDVGSRELRRGQERVRLQGQPFAILVMMLERPGQVVTREEFVERLWPDGTFVDFEHSLNTAVKRLRTALGDNADVPRFVETLPRQGYRFIGASSRQRGVNGRRPRMAVLPFTDDGDESGTCDFGDGLTDETILQLGRLDERGIDVVARSSSLAFRGGLCRAREIGAALRVDYLLEGSVRRQGDRARIAAWLVETSGETQLWTDVYDRYLTDALSVQADVASRIAGSLAAEISVSIGRYGAGLG